MVHESRKEATGDGRVPGQRADGAKRWEEKQQEQTLPANAIVAHNSFYAS